MCVSLADALKLSLGPRQKDDLLTRAILSLLSLHDLIKSDPCYNISAYFISIKFLISSLPFFSHYPST